MIRGCFFSMCISQSPSLRFLSPSSMNFFIAYDFFEVLCNCHCTIGLGILEMRCKNVARPWLFGIVHITFLEGKFPLVCHRDRIVVW